MKLKEKEKRKRKGEERLRKERKVTTTETACIKQIFSLPHVTKPLFVFSLEKVAILTHP